MIKKLEKQNGASWAVFLLKCLSCCLWCFEKCMKYINKNAYIEIAIYGYSFCTGNVNYPLGLGSAPLSRVNGGNFCFAAACQAFKTLLENVLRIAAVNFIYRMVIFFMKVFVAGTCAFVTVIIFKVGRPPLLFVALL